RQGDAADRIGLQGNGPLAITAPDDGVFPAYGDAVDDLVQRHGLGAVGRPDLHATQGGDVATGHLILPDAQDDGQGLVLLIEDANAPAFKRLFDTADHILAADAGPARPRVVEQRFELRHTLLPVGLLDIREGALP